MPLPYAENPCIFKLAGVYRSKLRDDIQGVEGDEIVRQRVEDFVNRMRPPGILVSTSSMSRC
jgi:maintenance of morphology protein 1